LTLFIYFKIYSIKGKIIKNFYDLFKMKIYLILITLLQIYLINGRIRQFADEPKPETHEELQLLLNLLPTYGYYYAYN
jgi:hypothetical protein